MPDRVQDLTNHRKVAQACKNYTDQKAEEILWQLAENDVSTSDDNTTASTKTVPSNATRVKIKRIYGLTQKFNPSVASDSTSAMVKTMPSTVYDFDVSKVEGKSEVGENLINPNAMFSTNTRLGITLTNNFDGSYTLSGTADTTSNDAYWFMSSNKDWIEQNIGNGYVSMYIPNQPNMFFGVWTGVTNYNVNPTANITANYVSGANFAIKMPIVEGQSYNITFKPTLVKGQDVPTEYLPYFDGIHNLELSGLKVEGSNVANLNNEGKAIYKNDGSLADNSNNATTDFIEVNEGEQYVNNIVPWTTSNYCSVAFYDSNKAIVSYYLGSTSSSTVRNLTIPSGVKYMRLSINVNSQTTLMCNRGTTLLDYAPYIAPTTKTIDLSSILYNGSPLFEGNSLKGIGTIKDEITPYKAIKRIAVVDLGTLIWEYDSDSKRFTSPSLTNLLYPSVQVATDVGLILSSMYNTISGQSQLNDLTLDMTISQGSGDYPIVRVRNLTYTNATTFKNAMNGVYIYCAMNTSRRITVDIDWSSTLRGITGYSNGTITLLNTNNQDTDNTITYNSMIKENCCAKVVQSRGGSVIATVNFPTQASDGWSAVSVNNVRDFTTNKRETNVNKNSNLGGLGFSYVSDTTRFFSSDLASLAKLPTNNDTVANLLSKDYDIVYLNYLIGYPNLDKLVALSNTGNLSIRDLLYTDATIFKLANANVPFYYELNDASKTETSIDSVDNVIEVEPSDVLSFYDENDNLVTVPSDLTYRIEVAQ